MNLKFTPMTQALYDYLAAHGHNRDDVLDASVELWAGAPGTAALDRAVDEAWTIADRHLKGGDFVGLAVVAARTLAWIEPGSSPGHAVKIATALAHSTSCLDPDRSGLDRLLPQIALAPWRASAHSTCSRTSADGCSRRRRRASSTGMLEGALPSPTARLRNQRS